MAFLRVRGGSISLVHGERKGLGVRHRRLHTFQGGAPELSACLDPTRWARLQLEVEQHHPEILIDWNRLHTEAQAIVDRLAPDRPPLTTTERIRAVQKACRVLRRHLRELPHDEERLWGIRCAGPELADTARQIAFEFQCLMPSHEREVKVFLDFLLPDAETAEVWVNKARAAGARKKYDKAREAFAQARVIDPCDPDIDNSEAIGYLERGMLDEATALFERARNLAHLQLPNPDRSYSWGELAVRPYVRATSNLALVRERQGRHDEALALYQECLRICPHDGIQARFALGAVYQRLGNLHQSLLHNTEHCRGNMMDIPDPFYDMSSALVQLNRPVEALERLMEGLEINHLIPRLLLKPPRRKISESEYTSVDSLEWAHAYVRDHRDLWPQVALDFLYTVMHDPTLRGQIEQLEALDADRESANQSEDLKQLHLYKRRAFGPAAVKALKQRLGFVPAAAVPEEGAKRSTRARRPRRD